MATEAAIDAKYSRNLSVCNTPLEADNLTDYSPKDKPWDTHRSESQEVEAIYRLSSEYERYAERIGDCSGVLRFGYVADRDTGELAFKLRHTHFCRVRHCPVCQWRRSLMWLARFHNALPEIEKAHPRARWVFMTLTVRNCPITDLRETLQHLGKSWFRFIKRKEFARVLGWVRTTEVTRGADGTAHPHFHVLMLVPSSMLGGEYYVPQKRWVQVWKECARLDYTPVLDVRAVKPKQGAAGQNGIAHAAAETLKYAVKPADMVADPAWFLTLTKQLRKMRFVATGGVLKDVLRVEDETQEELALLGEDAEKVEDNGARLAFSWKPTKKRYTRFAQGDKLPNEVERDPKTIDYITGKSDAEIKQKK